MFVCCLVVFVGEARCDQGFYLTVSGGYLAGHYDSAVEDQAFAGTAIPQSILFENSTPLGTDLGPKLSLSSSKRRDSFSPSIAVGYWLWDPVGIEISYTGDGRYDYAYEYVTGGGSGLTDNLIVATVRAPIHEKLNDVALRVPIRVTLNKDVFIDFVPGIARQELQATYSSQAVAEPGYGITSDLYDSPLYTRNIGRWAIEGGVRATLTLNPTFALVVGYRYTSAPAKQISLVSLGLTARY
jgi:hypothetical protein